MKKIYMIAFFCMMAINILADNTLSMDNMSVNAGNQITLIVNLNNTESISAMQFDLVLPDGVTIAKDAEEKALVSLSDRTTASNHGNLETSSLNSGAIRVMCASSSNAVFEGNSGAVLNITLNTSATMEYKEYIVTMQNIILSTDKSVMYQPSSTTATLTIIDPNAVSVTKIVLSKYSLEMSVGDTQTLKAYVSPLSATNRVVKWTTSDENIATVDANGNISAIGVGSATISATATDGTGITSSCVVTVTQSYSDGDVNSDGDVDSQDVLLIYEWMKSSTSTVTSTTREDVNHDGEVDSQDVLLVYEYMKNN